MFARTNRLLLRPAWREDAPALAEAIRDPVIARYLAMSPICDEEDACAMLRAAECNQTLPCLLAFQRTAGALRLVGATGLRRNADGDAELGCWIARPFWGLGFATEAARAVIDIATHGLRLPRIVARPPADNPGIARALKKLGFRAVDTGFVLDLAADPTDRLAA